MNLRQAVGIVIEQNKSKRFVPIRFIEITANGDHPDLVNIISTLILKSELLEYLEQQIDKYGEVLTVEDLVSLKDDGFGLSKEVIKRAKDNSGWFNQKRVTDDDWIRQFFKENKK